eukprot:Ihof_evm3s456 gene=Ihof_evmTU3s456
MERTYAMIKPDAVLGGHVDAIIIQLEENGFKIISRKNVTLSLDQAKLFYKEHEGRPFYEGLCSFMSSGPLVALVLEKENAIKDWRLLIGPTNSNKAREEAPT